MLPKSRKVLHALERLLKDAVYSIRYEKGNFHSGYCVVKDRKIIVINRFFDVEARISCLIEIIPLLNLDLNLIPEDSKKVLLQFNILDPTQEKLVA